MPADLFNLSASLAAASGAESFSIPSWAPHATALFAFASGIALWLAGRSYLRLTFALAGGALGAMSGFEAIHAFAPSMNPLIGAGAGLCAGALLGLIAFRFVVALSLGGVCATIAALATLAAFSAGVVAPTLPDSGAEHDFIAASPEVSSFRSLAETATNALTPLAFANESSRDFVGPMLSDAAGDLADHASERARLFFASLTAQVAPIWNDLPSNQRMALSAATIVGLLIGLLAGFLLPSRAAAVSTSFIGPAIWIPTGLFLLTALSVPIEPWAPARPLTWIGIWLGLATVGLVIQWTRPRKTADKA